MDAEPSPPPAKERIVNWGLARRRLRRPGVWVAILTVVALASMAGNVYLYTLEPEPAPYTPPEQALRFEGVHLIEGRTDRTFTEFGVSTWFSNAGEDGLGRLRFIVNAVEQGRGTTVGVSEFVVDQMPGHRTQNGSVSLRLNNTRSYQIEIMVLEDDFLIGRGYGSLGFRWSEDPDGRAFIMRSMAEPEVVLNDFTFHYSQ